MVTLVVHLTPVTICKELASLVSQRLTLILIIPSVLVNKQGAGLTLSVGKRVRIKERSLTYMEIAMKMKFKTRLMGVNTSIDSMEG